MAAQNILSKIIDRAIAQAVFDKLEENSYSGRIPSCKGVIPFATSLRECENQLRSTLEEWIQMGIKLGHPLCKM